MRLTGAMLLIAMWAALLTVLAADWTRRQFQLPPAWDHALYLSMSLRFHRALETGGASGLARTIAREPSPAAPLFPLSSTAFYSTFGESREAAQLTLIPYVFFMIAGTALYAFGRDEEAGRGAPVVALAVFCLSTYTGIVNFSREYLMDFPAAAFVTVALALLSRYGASVRAGVVAGLALLTKVLAGVFFVGPVLYLAIALKGERRRLAVFAAACIATAGLWYAVRLQNIVHYVAFYGFGEGSLPFRTSSNPGYYVLILLAQGVGWFPFAALALAGAVSLRRLRFDGFALAWLLGGLTLLTILPNKGGERYILALLPPLAVLNARAIAAARTARLRNALVAVTLAAGAANFAGLTWRSPLSAWTHSHFRPFPHEMSVEEELAGWPTAAVLEALIAFRPERPSRAAVEDYVRATQELDDRGFVATAFRDWLKREPDEAGWNAYTADLGTRPREDVVESIVRSDEFQTRALQILVVPNHRVFNPATLQYLAESERLPLRFRAPITGREPADAVIVKRGGLLWPGKSPGLPTEVVATVEERSSIRSERNDSFLCPDGSTILVAGIDD